MTGRVTGTLTIRGKTYAVDAIERMDRSWGERDPMKAGKPNHIVSATFGPDLAFHMICPWDPTRTGPEAFTLSHGYVLDDGEVHGLTDELEMTSVDNGLICGGLDMRVRDVRGREFHLRAVPDIGAPWIAAPPSAIVHNAMMRWFHGDRTGYGVVMRTFLLPDLNARFGRFHTDPSPAIRV